ncbi:hypothetical protein ACA910_013214 [Epithemia clementina (nom. ined.)]
MSMPQGVALRAGKHWMQPPQQQPQQEHRPKPSTIPSVALSEVLKSTPRHPNSQTCMYEDINTSCISNNNAQSSANVDSNGGLHQQVDEQMGKRSAQQVPRLLPTTKPPPSSSSPPVANWLSHRSTWNDQQWQQSLPRFPYAAVANNKSSDDTTNNNEEKNDKKSDQNNGEEKEDDQKIMNRKNSVNDKAAPTSRYKFKRFARMAFLPSSYQVTNQDVVCGRGRGYFERPGNIRFRDIVKAHVHHYSTARSKMEKTAVLGAIVDYIQMVEGGRFLKERLSNKQHKEKMQKQKKKAKKVDGGGDGNTTTNHEEEDDDDDHDEDGDVEDEFDGGWEELDDVTARDKVGHAMRVAVMHHRHEELARQKRRESGQQCTTKQCTTKQSMPPLRPTPLPTPLQEESSEDVSRGSDSTINEESTILGNKQGQNDKREPHPAQKEHQQNQLRSTTTQLEKDPDPQEERQDQHQSAQTKGEPVPLLQQEQQHHHQCADQESRAPLDPHKQQQYQQQFAEKKVPFPQEQQHRQQFFEMMVPFLRQQEQQKQFAEMRALYSQQKQYQQQFDDPNEIDTDSESNKKQQDKNEETSSLTNIETETAMAENLLGSKLEGVALAPEESSKPKKKKKKAKPSPSLLLSPPPPTSLPPGFHHPTYAMYPPGYRPTSNHPPSVESYPPYGATMMSSKTTIPPPPMYFGGLPHSLTGGGMPMPLRDPRGYHPYYYECYYGGHGRRRKCRRSRRRRRRDESEEYSSSSSSSGSSTTSSGSTTSSSGSTGSSSPHSRRYVAIPLDKKQMTGTKETKSKRSLEMKMDGYDAVASREKNRARKGKGKKKYRDSNKYAFHLHNPAFPPMMHGYPMYPPTGILPPILPSGRGSKHGVVKDSDDSSDGKQHSRRGNQRKMGQSRKKRTVVEMDDIDDKGCEEESGDCDDGSSYDHKYKKGPVKQAKHFSKTKNVDRKREKKRPDSCESTNLPGVAVAECEQEEKYDRVDGCADGACSVRSNERMRNESQRSTSIQQDNNQNNKSDCNYNQQEDYCTRRGSVIPLPKKQKIINCAQGAQENSPTIVPRNDGHKKECVSRQREDGGPVSGAEIQTAGSGTAMAARAYSKKHDTAVVITAASANSEMSSLGGLWMPLPKENSTTTTIYPSSTNNAEEPIWMGHTVQNHWYTPTSGAAAAPPLISNDYLSLSSMMMPSMTTTIRSQKKKNKKKKRSKQTNTNP